MSVTLVRQPPADASAGYMSVRYQESGRTITIAKFHLNNIDSASVASEFNGLLPFLHPFFDTSWAVQLTALTERVGSTLRRIPVPTASSGGYLQHAGTSSTATTGAEGYIQSILEFSTASNHHARVRLVGVGGQNIDVDAAVSPNAGGTDLEKLVNYLTTSGTIVAHDGTALTTPVHLTYALVSRPRRQAMRVA